MPSLTSDPGLTPAMKVPPGLHSNLIDPPSADYLTIIICVLIPVLSTSFVGLRLYTRQFITRQVWWDDWCCVLGWIFEIAVAGLLFKSLDYGGDTDLWNVSKAKDTQFTELFHDMKIIAQTGMFFIKASIVLIYRRLFLPPGIGRSHIWWSIWFVFYWNLFYALALIIAVAAKCVGKADDASMGKGCPNQYVALVCTSVINVVSDLMIMVIPIAAIWGLHMAKEKKIKLIAVFAVGSLGVLASVARLGYQVLEAKKPNHTILLMISMELNIVEQMIGIIVSSMPSLPAFIRHLRGGAPSTSTSFEPLSQRGIKKTSEVNVLWYKRSSRPDRGHGGAGMGLDDPSLLYSADCWRRDARYEELTNLEGQKGLQTKRGGLEGFMDNMTRTTVEVGRAD